MGGGRSGSEGHTHTYTHTELPADTFKESWMGPECGLEENTQLCEVKSS